MGDVDHALLAFKKSVDRRFSSLREAFFSMSTGRKTRLDREDFCAALRSTGIELSADKMEELRRKFDPRNSGLIGFSDFCRGVSSSFEYGEHIDRQLFK